MRSGYALGMAWRMWPTGGVMVVAGGVLELGIVVAP